MYSLGTRLSVYTANRGEISLENRNKISICAPTRLLKRLRQCNAERRGVKFDSTERRQKGGEGSLVPNVTRSQNQPSSVSYTYIYTQPSPPIPGRPRHIAAARLVYTNNRAFSANKKKKKKKLPSTCPKLLRQQLSCDAWRGVKGHGDGRFSLRYRDCENGTDRSPTRGNHHHHHHHHQLSRSTTTTLLLSTRSFIFRSTLFSIYYSGGERGRSKRSCPLSLSLSSLFRKGSLAPLASLSSPRSSGAI